MTVAPPRGASPIRILACDDISAIGLGALRAPAYELVRRSSLDADTLARLLPDFDALLVRSGTPVTGSSLAGAQRLRLVGRAGYGLDTVDVEAATARGVAVMHSPEGTGVAAAEFTIGLMFSLARHIPQADAAMRAGRWEKRRYRGTQLRGRRLGVVGMGTVGREVVRLAVAIGMQVGVYDPAVDAVTVAAEGAEKLTWDEVLERSDFLTVHVPGSARTRGLISGATMARMKDGVRIVVTSRGGVVDERALIDALRSGKVAAAAVDVFDREPPWGNELLTLPSVIVTPHLLAATFEAQIEVARGLASQVASFFERGDAQSVVNPEALIGRTG